MTHYVSSSKLPGVGAASLKDGKMTSLLVSGLRKNDLPKLIQKEDQFHLGSCTKAMTATLVAKLIEEGYFRWDSILPELLPDLALHADYQNTTIEMLLTHRSGLRRDSENFSNDWLFKYLHHSKSSPTEDRQFFSQTLLELPATISPGQFNYSNGGYIVLGHLMEKVTGQSWENLMQEKIFDQLGMSSCGQGPTNPRQIWGHFFQNEIYYPLHADNPVAFGPAARIHCSLNDWSKFLQQHIDGFNGQNGIVNAQSFKKLHTTYPNGNYTYGGWYLQERTWAGGITLSHNGSNTMNFANVWLVPKKDIILMSVTNAGGKYAAAFTEEAMIQMIKEIDN